MSRDARTGPARDRARTGQGRRERPPQRRGRPRRCRRQRAALARAGARRATPARRGSGPGDGLVVGAVPAVARVTGALLVLAALAGVAALFPTYLVVGGQELSTGDRVRRRAGRACSSRWSHLAVGVVPACAAPSRSSAWPTPGWPARWPSASC